MLPTTKIAQPLIFAVQSAATAAMAARGLRPSVVLGHSVGEVAAAEAAGIFDLRTAVEVIYSRSARQEATRGTGRMMAVLAPAETVKDLLAAVPGVEIAAFNSPRAVTVAGPRDALAELKRRAGSEGIAVVELDLDYPFHSAQMAGIERHLLADLKNIVPLEGLVPFVSTVTGSCLPRSRLNARYWWRNIREPVQFMAGVREAAKLGARFFVEIGPRSTLLRHISDSLAGEAEGIVVLSALDRGDAERDPLDKLVVAGTDRRRAGRHPLDFRRRSGALDLAAVLSVAAVAVPLPADDGGFEPRRDRAASLQRRASPQRRARVVRPYRRGAVPGARRSQGRRAADLPRHRFHGDPVLRRQPMAADRASSCSPISKSSSRSISARAKPAR